MRIVIDQHVMDQISHVHRSAIGRQAPSQRRIQVLQVPRGDVGEFLGGLDDRDDFAAREDIQPT
jgi:hypothetical protein